MKPFKSIRSVLIVPAAWAAGGMAVLPAAEAAGAAPAATNVAAATPAPSDAVGQLLVRVSFLQTEVFGEPLWKYLAFLAYIALAFLSAYLVNWLVSGRLKAWAARTATQYDDILLQVVQGPVKVITFVIVLNFGLRVFAWPVVVQDYLSKGLRVVVAWSLTFMVIKAMDLLLVFWRQRAAAAEDVFFNQQLFPLVRRVGKYFIILIAALLTAQNLGIEITSLLAGLSIGGLAIGLAAQDTLANLFGAVALFMDKPCAVGDRVKVEGYDGVVEEIGLRSTRIRNLDGHLVTIPNKTMANASITNISKRPNIRTVMTIGITYDTPAEKVKLAGDIITEVFKSHPMTADVWVSFNQFADCSLSFLVIHWWNSTDYKAYLAGMQEMNLTLKARFDAAGLSFAFPTRTLYVKQDSDWRITGVPQPPPPAEPPPARG
jgi:MscS family membrane protein